MKMKQMPAPVGSIARALSARAPGHTSGAPPFALRSLVSAAWTMCVLTAAADAQCDGAWVHGSTQDNLTSRTNHAMTFDARRERVVLFGGVRSSSFGETWEHDGANWNQISAPGPSSRFSHSIAFDDARGVVLLFGGKTVPGGNSGFRNDTWTWEGAVWTRRETEDGPSPRSDAVMEYDPITERVVLFGGFTGSAVVSDTWEWNGVEWTQIVTPPGGPSARRAAAACFDPLRGRIVMFGGNNLSTVSGDMWEWTGSEWLLIPQPGPSPSGRSGAVLEAIAGRLLLFGGSSSVGQPVPDSTWVHDGAAWTEVTPAPNQGPTPRTTVGTYDARRRHVVTFGGYSGDGFERETWIWSPTAVLTRQPSDVHRCPSAPASFAVEARGIGPFAYQWQVNRATPEIPEWCDLSDSLPGGGCRAVSGPQSDALFSGSTSPTLIIANLSPADSRGYRCVVTNACGSVPSNHASLSVCRADFNCDNLVSSADFFDFLTVFFINGPAADFDTDGSVTSQDFFDFLTAFFAGCP